MTALDRPWPAIAAGILVVALLSLKIALSALVLLGGFGITVGALYRAGDALDGVLNGGRRAWFRVIGWFLLACLGVAGGAYVAVYWGSASLAWHEEQYQGSGNRNIEAPSARKAAIRNHAGNAPRLILT